MRGHLVEKIVEPPRRQPSASQHDAANVAQVLHAWQWISTHQHDVCSKPRLKGTEFLCRPQVCGGPEGGSSEHKSGIQAGPY